MHGDPYAVSVEHFERGIGCFALAHERKPAEVCMCADTHIAFDLLRRVVHGADVRHRVRSDAVEVIFWKVEREREDVKHVFAKLVHCVVVAVYRRAPKEGIRVRGPLIPWLGGGGGNGSVLLWVGGVFAHEEPFFEV
jgi:hypothetical protein